MQDFPDQDEFADYSPSPRRPRQKAPKHSAVGIASLVTAGVTAFLMIVGTIWSTVIVMNNPRDPESDPAIVIAGLLILAGMLAAVVGVVLGIIGVSTQGTKKVTAIVGLSVCGFLLVAIGGLMCIGMVMG